MPDNKILSHGRPPQINIPVLEPQVFRHLNFFIERERWRLAAVQNAQLVNQHLYLTGFQVGIGHVARPPFNLALDSYYPLTAQIVCLGMHFCVDLRAENHLGQAPAVPQVNKYNPAMVPAP